VFSCQSDSIYVFAFEQHCQHIAAVDVQKQTGSTVTSPTTPTSAAPSSLVIQVTVSIVAVAKNLPGYNSQKSSGNWKNWKSPRILSTLLENFIITSLMAH